MVRLTRLNGTEMYLNADLIATVEGRPDTVITLVDGKHFVVAEAPARVVELITAYRAAVLALADTIADPDFEPMGLRDPEPSPQDAQLYHLHTSRRAELRGGE